jgi:8-oxo-(d)GTP phosphatase
VLFRGAGGPKRDNARMPLLLVRHAWAGDRTAWELDDRLRPLDERGRRQAAALVEQLEEYPLTAIYSSPAVRCTQTVEPLARARSLAILEREELSEERQDGEGRSLVRSLAGSGVLVCGHGGLQHGLHEPPKWRKGETLVVSADLRVLSALRT